MSDYHKIMANEIHGRGGHEPDFAGERSPNGHCEIEHDWCLLMIARSARVQQGIANAITVLESSPADVDRQRVQYCRMLLGDVSHNSEIGYATMARVADLLAIAANVGVAR